MKRVIVILLLGMVVHFGFAQSSGSSRNNVVVQLNGDVIRSAGGVLVIQDSVATALAIGDVSVGGQSLWIKKSDIVPERRGVVHYWYNSQEKQLVVRFSPQDLPTFPGKTVALEVVGIKGPVTPGLQVKSPNGAVLPVIRKP